MRVPAAIVFPAVAALVAACGSGGQSTSAAPASAARLHVSSSAFINNSRLAKQYTCDGAGEEPAVQAGTVPASTSELVLIVADPDAPSGTFFHLTRYGLKPRGPGSGSVNNGGTEGRNSAGSTGWTPPCPPKGSGTHHYVWTVYALRDSSNLPAGATPAQVTAAVKAPLASGSITALYSR
jgi:Raf kinase inhibitor-like YbhB/YbcL family protein